jgi:hypothetical protein
MFWFTSKKLHSLLCVLSASSPLMSKNIDSVNTGNKKNCRFSESSKSLLQLAASGYRLSNLAIVSASWSHSLLRRLCLLSVLCFLLTLCSLL